MIGSKKKIGIIGTGGSARETLLCLIDGFGTLPLKIEDIVCFFERDSHLKDNNVMGVKVLPQSEFDPSVYDVVVGIGDSALRKKVVQALPVNTTFTNIIHPDAIISKWVEIGEGSVITAGTVLTCNIKIGNHAQLNLHTNISHDCEIGDYFTTAPGVNISGICKFGDCVYFGTNSSVRQGINICSNVTIGMGGVVVKDILEEGVYIGNPVKKL